MSAYARIVQDLATARLGPMATLHFSRHTAHVRSGGGTRCVARIERPDAHGNPEVVALAGGADSGEACRALLAMLSRDDLTLTTVEVAAVLGVDPSRVRHRLRDGRLVAATPGGPGGWTSARFEPAEVWRVVGG